MNSGSVINLLALFATIAMLGNIVSGSFIPQQAQQQQQPYGYAINAYQPPLAPNHIDAAQLQQQLGNLQPPVSDNAANIEMDDDDEEEDRIESRPTQPQQMAASGVPIWQQNGQPIPSDLKPAASKHYHHKHGAKGWLDMGAWTGKKGAFGWHDKHPVGKGRR